MSISIAYMKQGVVTNVDFENLQQLLPQIAYLHDNRLPYNVSENGNIIFRGNVKYATAESKPKNSWTLKIKVSENEPATCATYTDYVELAKMVAQAQDAGLPWFFLDDNTGKLVRKGNIKPKNPTPPAPATPAALAGASIMFEPEMPDDIVNFDIDAALADVDAVIEAPGETEPEKEERHPIFGMTYKDAVAYLKKSGFIGRHEHNFKVKFYVDVLEIYHGIHEDEAGDEDYTELTRICPIPGTELDSDNPDSYAFD